MGFFGFQHSIWHKGKTKRRHDERSLGLFALLMDQTMLESVLPPYERRGGKERRQEGEERAGLLLSGTEKC